MHPLGHLIGGTEADLYIKHSILKIIGGAHATVYLNCLNLVCKIYTKCTGDTQIKLININATSYTL